MFATVARPSSGNIADGTAVGLSLLVAFLLFTLTRRELYALSSTYERHLRAEEEKTEQLRESRESYQITLKSIGDAVVSTDAAGRISFLNPAAQQLTGWNYEAARGRPLREVLRLWTKRPARKSTIRWKQFGSRRAWSGFTNNLLLTSSSQQQYPIELNAAPILNDHGQLVGVVIVFRDITERRQTEQTLRASERLAQAGRLSATIAHEIRNPLDTVSNLVYLLRHEQKTSDSSAQYLEMASDELARIAQITSQLLTFHREARTPVDVDLTDVIQSVLVLHAPQITESHIKVEQRLETASAGARFSRRTAAGVFQSGRQCHRCHAAGRQAHRAPAGVEPGLRSSLQRAARDRSRHWRRNSGWRAPESVCAVLYNQGREGNRT